MERNNILKDRHILVSYEEPNWIRSRFATISSQPERVVGILQLSLSVSPNRPGPKKKTTNLTSSQGSAAVSFTFLGLTKAEEFKTLSLYDHTTLSEA